MLDALIDRKLIKEEAKRRGMTVSDKDLDQAIQEFKRRNNIPDDEALKQALAKAGLSLKELKQQISEQIQYDRLVRATMAGKTKVSEAEVRRYYEEKYAKGGGKQQVHLRIIAMPFPAGATEAQKEETTKRAEAVLKEYRETKSLEGIKQKYSLEINDLGYVVQDDLNPQLAEFLSKHKAGDMAPIVTPQGFQLIFLVDRRSGKPLSYEEAQGEIRQLLGSKDMEKSFSEWVKTLREKALIKIML
jgi:parvulin-like peptidyl-prolyl isomerase